MPSPRRPAPPQDLPQVPLETYAGLAIPAQVRERLQEIVIELYYTATNMGGGSGAWQVGTPSVGGESPTTHLGPVLDAFLDYYDQNNRLPERDEAYGKACLRNCYIDALRSARLTDDRAHEIACSAGGDDGSFDYLGLASGREMPPVEVCEQRELIQVVRREVERLPVTQVRVVQGCLDGRSMAEVGAETGTTAGAAANRFLRAKDSLNENQKLRALLAAD